MKILAVSDLHVGAGRKYQDYLSRYESMISRIKEEASRTGHLLVLGDIFDRPSNLKERDLVLSFFSDLSRQGVSTLVIPGQHDWITKEYSQLDILNVLDFPGVHYFKTSFLWKEWEVPVDLRPWDFRKNGPDLEWDPSSVLRVSHVPLKDARILKRTLGHGEDYSSWPQDGALYLLGDVHFRQRVREDIWYCGSPLQHNHGELPDGHGGLLIEVGGRGQWSVQELDFGISGLPEREDKRERKARPVLSQDSSEVVDWVQVLLSTMEKEGYDLEIVKEVI